MLRRAHSPTHLPKYIYISTYPSIHLFICIMYTYKILENARTSSNSLGAQRVSPSQISRDWLRTFTCTANSYFCRDLLHSGPSGCRDRTPSSTGWWQSFLLSEPHDWWEKGRLKSKIYTVFVGAHLILLCNFCAYKFDLFSYIVRKCCWIRYAMSYSHVLQLPVCLNGVYT